LGRQDVRIQLGLAKDYRNQWKVPRLKTTRSSTNQPTALNLHKYRWAIRPSQGSRLLRCTYWKAEALHTSAKNDPKTTNISPIVTAGEFELDLGLSDVERAPEIRTGKMKMTRS